MENKPVVIIIDNSPDTTGAFHAIYNFALYAKSDFRFIFILPKGSRVGAKVISAGFKVVYFPLIEISKSPKSLLLYLPYLFLNTLRLLKLVRKYQVQIVHVNDFYNLLGATGKLMGGKYKLLTHVRFMPDRFPRLLLKLWTGAGIIYSEHLICVSCAVKSCLPEHVKIMMIYDTIAAILYPKKIKKKSFSSKNIHLLYLAHYIPGKGQDHALEAFYKAYQLNHQLKLKFVGGDMGLKKNQDFKEFLKKRAVALEIDHIIEFTGPTERIESEFIQSDIALNFSESESFSFTCLEALAYGIPLIVTDCGGPSELFEDGRSGILVPNRNIEKMASAILQLTNDASLRANFSRNGISFVLNKFSQKNTLECLFNIYQHLF